MRSIAACPRGYRLLLVFGGAVTLSAVNACSSTGSEPGSATVGGASVDVTAGGTTPSGTLSEARGGATTHTGSTLTAAAAQGGVLNLGGSGTVSSATAPLGGTSPSVGGASSLGGSASSGGTTSRVSTSTTLGGSSSMGGMTSRGGSTSASSTTSRGGSSNSTSTSTTSSYYVSDLCALADSTNAWGPIEKDLSNGEQAEGDGGPLTIAGTIYSKGLGSHAPSDAGFALDGNCTAFTARVGIDDEMRSAGSVLFEVWGDGTRLYQSAALTGASSAVDVSVDITGVRELRLVANANGGNGSDHADFGDAKILCSRPPASTCPRATPTPTAPAGYRLVWSDEFNIEGRPNSANWNYERGFVRNEEAQYYQEANATVKAGFLVIEGRRERVTNPNYQAGSSDWKRSRQYGEYTSASLHSSGKQTFQFGRFEMRGRIVAQAGLWPAWWTLGVAGEWPSNGEIDIMEYYNNLLHANVACGTNTQWQAKWDSVTKSIASFGVADWDAKFHIWRMDWDNTTIALYVDDIQQNTTNLADMLNPNGQSPFRQAHYILLNLAIGGQNGGDPANATFPSRYEVDYVRVYQK